MIDFQAFLADGWLFKLFQTGANWSHAFYSASWEACLGAVATAAELIGFQPDVSMGFLQGSLTLVNAWLPVEFAYLAFASWLTITLWWMWARFVMRSIGKIAQAFA